MYIYIQVFLEQHTCSKRILVLVDAFQKLKVGNQLYASRIYLTEYSRA